ncbi:MAG: CHASE4 domain-containing protein [Archaeoglobaceae archaeon]
MKIRSQVLLILLPTAILIYIGCSLAIYFVGLKISEEVYHSYVNEKLVTFESIIENSVSSLKTTCQDWAIWDDTYKFVESPNEAYIRSNLNSETFLYLQLNFMIFVYKNDDIIWMKFFDEKFEEEEMPENLLKKIFESKGKSGILKVDDQLFIISSNEILPSSGKGEANGYLYMGKILQKDEIKRMADILNLKLAEDSKDNQEVFFFKISALDGEEISIPLKIENMFRSSFREALLFALFSQFVVISSFLTFALILSKNIINKIEKIEKFAKEYPKNRNKKIEINSDDEVGYLVKSINSMLEEINRNEKKLLEVNEDLNFVLRILRHDIKNILFTVKSLLEVYIETKNDELLKKIENAIERGFNILSICRGIEFLNEGLKKIKISEVLKKFSNVKINLKGDAEVLANDGIEIVFGNLIDNAIKHGNATEINVEVENSKEFVILKFSDNGSGIPEEIRDRLFSEGFSYGKKAGTGLGLYIIKRLMERFGGRIELRENTFYLYFRRV